MPDYSTWLTKQQAAKALNCATKTVEQLAKAQKLQTAKYKRPEGGPALSVYHPDDVERLHKERNPEAEAFVLPAETKASTSLQRPGNAHPGADALTEYLAVLRDYGQHQLNNLIPLREKVFLTLPEAVQFTGLPDAVIRRMIHKTLKGEAGLQHVSAIMTGQGWRVRRKDLEAL